MMLIIQKVCIFATDICTFNIIVNMKTIKILGIFLLLAVMSVGFTSCGDDYESRLPELIIKNLEFDKSGGEQTMVFRNEDLTNYGITANAIWCSPWIDYDASTIYVKVTARGEAESDEEKYDERSCVVTLTDVRDNTTRTFTVKQAKVTDVIVKLGDDSAIDSNGGDVIVDVQYNVGWNVEIPEDAQDWITRKTAGTRGLEKTTVTLTVAKNNSGGARSSKVYFKSEDGSISKYITINQLFTPVYSFEKKEFTVDELGQTIKVNYESNINFSVYPDDDWVNKDGSKEKVDGSENKYVQKFTISEFTEKKESRTTKVEFSASVRTAPNDDPKTFMENITITQKRTLYIPIDSVKLMVGDSIIVEVINTEKRDLVWSSSDEKEFTVNSKGQVKCVAIDGDGQATITVKSKDGKYSDKIIAVAEKPKDLTKFLVCKWDSTQTIKEGVSSTILTFKITNTSSESITLTGYTAYKDSADVTKWYEEPLSETLAANKSKQINLGAIPTTNYYMKLRYTYMNEKYILGYSKKGIMTITKETTTPPAATRRSARYRRR
jgi:hypothetical protein